MKWHDFSSTQQVLSYSWHCSAGLGSSGSWSSHRSSLRRFSALYSSSTGKSSTGHRQLVTFSNVKAMDRLGITQASFLSSPPQFNTTQYLQPPPILTHRQLELEFSAKAQQKEQIKSMSRFAIVYIHKKIESCKYSHSSEERHASHKRPIHNYFYIHCVGLQHVKPLHTPPSVCTKPLWSQVPSTSCEDLLFKAKKYWASAHPPLFLCSSVLQYLYLLFLQRRERVHTASTRKSTTKAKPQNYKETNTVSSGMVKKVQAALFLWFSQAAWRKTLVDHSPPPTDLWVTAPVNREQQMPWQSCWAHSATQEFYMTKLKHSGPRISNPHLTKFTLMRKGGLFLLLFYPNTSQRVQTMRRLEEIQQVHNEHNSQWVHLWAAVWHWRLNQTEVQSNNSLQRKAGKSQRNLPFALSIDDTAHGTWWQQKDLLGVTATDKTESRAKY